MSLARSVFRHLKWLLTFFQPATVSSCLSISTILEVFTGNALHLALGRPSITGRHGLLSVASPRRLPIDFKRERERERVSCDGSPVGEETVVSWQKCRRKVDVSEGSPSYDVASPRRSDVCRLEDFQQEIRHRLRTYRSTESFDHQDFK